MLCVCVPMFVCLCAHFIVLPTTNDAASRSAVAIIVESEHILLRPLADMPFLVAKKINSICIGEKRKKNEKPTNKQTRNLNELECFLQKSRHICCSSSLSSSSSWMPPQALPTLSPPPPLHLTATKSFKKKKIFMHFSILSIQARCARPWSGDFYFYCFARCRCRSIQMCLDSKRMNKTGNWHGCIASIEIIRFGSFAGKLALGKL